jgi:anhydro-N-acetylmuramic acid kinase
MSIKNSQLYLGVMSGTSLDAIDCAIVEFDSKQNFKLINHYSHPIPESIRTVLFSLTQPQINEVNLLAEMDVKLGELIALACLEAIKQAKLLPNQISAIGSHGQTIRHYPQGNFNTSLQIGDANIICERTGIITIADFRRRDMAAGGQGAPLVPPFHAAIFQHQSISRCIVNIGGIANITCLPALSINPNNSLITGFDTGPGNTLMDLWCKEHLNCSYDENGELASSGMVSEELLQEMLNDPYFSLNFPKSTGREYFGKNWIKSSISNKYNLNNQQLKLNILATLTELTACSISKEINTAIPESKEIIICGGGAKNSYLLKRLKHYLAEKQIKPSDSIGVPAQWVESMAFAWLAKQTHNKLTSNLPSVTGAKHSVILGAIYQNNI